MALALLHEDVRDAGLAALAARLEARGAVVVRESARAMRRMAEDEAVPDVIALLGSRPVRDLDGVMATEGLVLALVGLRYPANVGFVIRSAEVAGAAGVVLSNDWSGDELAEARRVAMGADRFLGFAEAPFEAVLEASRAAGRRVLALETTGRETPWSVDWTRPATLFVGGEAEGLPPTVLESADAVLRIPTRGFVPSYNVQAAVGIVLGECLRQDPQPRPRSAADPAER